MGVKHMRVCATLWVYVCVVCMGAQYINVGVYGYASAWVYAYVGV